MDATADVEVQLGQGDVALTARDRTLLQAVAAHGSLNSAADALGRSYAHAQRRIVELEDAFGPLVDRSRGGSGGGGSELTDTAEQLLARFQRLQAEFDGVATAAETVLRGTVVDRDGELATVETSPGTVRAIVDTKASPGDAVEVGIRADTVTLNAPPEAPEPTGTSARNRFAGTVANVDEGTSIALVSLAVEPDTTLSALVTDTSLDKLDITVGADLVASFKATATVGVLPAIEHPERDEPS
ncbi:LysR family transcriptional regulator [Haloarcula sp. CBA1130]|uniref:TOBE domain-containing protein n=1 Tax=unclassified Haloarcula TaxID=2624677 RepID=UPI00124419C5|nr:MULTISPECIES: TOBE domain-containing protein [unclassified Haloarcula]KAA9398980.1 LysR family transcriptional regulator [Haloarcula sp. CBA1129]KAA9403495.1 LysR family transcriptional regulator [Haloarcula sp. CBA1130]